MDIISRSEAKKKGLPRYFTGKMCKYGHVSERHTSGGNCVVCQENSEYHKNYYKENKERMDKKNKDYVRKNKNSVAEYKRKWAKENKDKCDLARDKWLSKNAEFNREYKRSYCKKKYKEDQNFRCSQICRWMLKRALKSNKQYYKNNTTNEMLGYDGETLRSTLEGKFLYGMSWENYGEWEVDHVYPVSRYIEDGVSDPSVINSLDNLLPMWKEDNRQKLNKSLRECLIESPEQFKKYEKFL